MIIHRARVAVCVPPKNGSSTMFRHMVEFFGKHNVESTGHLTASELAKRCKGKYDIYGVPRLVDPRFLSTLHQLNRMKRRLKLEDAMQMVLDGAFEGLPQNHFFDIDDIKYGTIFQVSKWVTGRPAMGQYNKTDTPRWTFEQVADVPLWGDIVEYYSDDYDRMEEWTTIEKRRK